MPAEALKIDSFKPEDERISDSAFVERLSPFGHKLFWFLNTAKGGYVPHYYQMLFHTMRYGDKLSRFRHLVAGRRGGKTLSAAWEVLFYALHPATFHLDAHGEDDDRPLHIWVLTKDYPVGRTAWRVFEDCMRRAGLKLGTDYKRNLGEKFFEFTNGTFVEFKTADDPQSLRGAGLDLLWIDEAAFIDNEDAWTVVRPALSDKSGIVITTTTPHGKNWFYREFFKDEAKETGLNGYVEYWSIQNPYFPREEWEIVKRDYHPLLFKQEFKASFDSMAGKELQGDWLQYYEWDDLPRDPDTKKWKLKLFMGVDPAISLSDKADRFAMALVGISDNGQAYLIDQYADRIPFPEQITKILSWYSNWRDKGLELIGVESNAFQAAIEQQLATIGPVMPIIPIISKGKKSERIMRMSNLFRIGKVKIRRDHRDFIEEWIDYDTTLKNPEDDCLDAVEITLGTAGTLLPMMPSKDLDPDRPWGSVDELARRSIPGGDMFRGKLESFDPEFGVDF